jgi:hypothetical protein
MNITDKNFKGTDFTTSQTSSSDSKPGFKAPDIRYFITDFVITRSTSEEDTNTFTLSNPLITNINADKLAYAESGLVEYQITFNYEGYHVDNSYTATNSAGETILDNSKYNNPNESTGPSLPVPKNSAGETFIDTWKYDNPDDSTGPSLSAAPTSALNTLSPNYKMYGDGTGNTIT